MTGTESTTSTDQGHVAERLDAARKALADAMTALDQARQMATGRNFLRRVAALAQHIEGTVIDEVDEIIEALEAAR